jgi:hypothetical protein
MLVFESPHRTPTAGLLFDRLVAVIAGLTRELGFGAAASVVASAFLARGIVLFVLGKIVGTVRRIRFEADLQLVFETHGILVSALRTPLAWHSLLLWGELPRTSRRRMVQGHPRATTISVT